jgi:hypothetical protein
MTQSSLTRQNDVVRDYMRKYYGSVAENSSEKKPVVQKRMVKKTHLKKSEPTTVHETNDIGDLNAQVDNEEKELNDRLLLSAVSSNRESFKKPTNDEPSNFGFQFKKQMVPGANIMSSDSKFDSNTHFPGERGSMLSRRDLEQKFGQSMRAIVETQESKEALETYKAESERFIREINGSLHRSMERDFLDNVVKSVRLMDIPAPQVNDKLNVSQRSLNDLFPQASYEDMMAKEASTGFYNSIKNKDKAVRASIGSLSKNEPTENLLNYNSIQSRDSKSDAYSDQEIIDRILSGTKKPGDFRKVKPQHTDAPAPINPPFQLPHHQDESPEHNSNYLNEDSESYPHLESIRDLGAKFSVSKITDSIPNDLDGHDGDGNSFGEEDSIPQFNKNPVHNLKSDSGRNSDLPSFTKKHDQVVIDAGNDHHNYPRSKNNKNLESNYNTNNDDEEFNYQTERQLSVNEYFSTPSNQEPLKLPTGQIKAAEGRPVNRSISSHQSSLDQSVDPDTLLPSELIDRNIQKSRPLFDNFDRRNHGNCIYDNQFEEPNILTEEYESEPNTKLTILPGVVRNSDISQNTLEEREASKTLANAFYFNERNKLSFKQGDFFKLPEGLDQPSNPKEYDTESQEVLQENIFRKVNEANVDEFDEEVNFQTEQPQTLDRETFGPSRGRDESSITDIETHRMLLNVQSENSDRVMIDMNSESRPKPIFTRQPDPEEEDGYYLENNSQDNENNEQESQSQEGIKEDELSKHPDDNIKEDVKEPSQESSGDYNSEKAKKTQTEFDSKLNVIIGKMLNAKATIIQKKWLQVAEAKRESVQIETLFNKFLQLKKAAIKANKYQIESKVATQTHHYSLASIAKDFGAHLNSLQKGSPMVQGDLRELLKHLHVLLIKLNIVFES